MTSQEFWSGYSGIELQTFNLTGSLISEGYHSNIRSSSSSNDSYSGVSARFYLYTYNNSGTRGSSYRGRRFRGTPTSPSGVLINDNLLHFSADGYNGTGVVSPAGAIAFAAAENWTTGANGTYFKLKLTQTGQTVFRDVFEINHNGYVGILNNNPQYALDVFGYGNFNSGLYINSIPVVTGNNENYIKSGEVIGIFTLRSETGNFYPKNNPQNYASSGQFISGISITGGLAIQNALNINAGANITLTQSSNNTLSIAAAAGASIASLVSGISVSGGSSLTGLFSIIQGSNITLTQLGNTGIIIGGAAGAGEANTASSLGEGQSLFNQKVGVDLRFNSISGGTGLLVSISGGNTIFIDSNLNTGQFYAASNLQQYIKSGEAVRLANVTQAILGEKTFSNLVANKSTFVNGIGTITGMFWDVSVPVFYARSSDNLASVDIEERTLSGQWKSQFPPTVSGQRLITGNQSRINNQITGVQENINSSISFNNISGELGKNIGWGMGYNKTTSNMSNALSATLMNISGLNFYAQRDSIYGYEAFIPFFTNTATCGLTLYVSGPTGIGGTGMWSSEIMLTSVAGTDAYQSVGRMATPTVSGWHTTASVAPINHPHFAKIKGYWVTSNNSGIIQLQFAPEVNTNIATIMKGAWVKYF